MTERKSRFTGLAAALNRKDESQAKEKKKVAKSQDKENYAQTTVYLARKGIYDPLQSALAEERLEYSQLVEDLLKDWLAKRKRLDV